MKKIILIIIAILAFVASFIAIKFFKRSSTTATHTIGILQTASHPALDASRDGFIEELTSKLGNSVAFVIHNAQGSIAQAHAIAQQFHSNKRYNGFFAIATPAAQAMSALEKERPIFIAAVTDPHALGLIHPTTNVCGVKDMIDVKAEVEMLVQLIPNARQVGLIYTSGETNSITLVKQMRQELEARGLTAVDFAISNESDMQAAVELACRKVDVILTPTDNTVASTISLITAITLKNKKPLIVSDNMLVTFGALASRGVDYKASGKRAAQIAYEVIVNGKKPYELPIEQAKSEQIFINKTTLETLGLTIPAPLEKFVVFVS
jgi:putative tryptophan/tyrosine transport system substrate-binding protein